MYKVPSDYFNLQFSCSHGQTESISLKVVQDVKTLRFDVNAPEEYSFGRTMLKAGEDKMHFVTAFGDDERPQLYWDYDNSGILGIDNAVTMKRLMEEELFGVQALFVKRSGSILTNDEKYTVVRKGPRNEFHLSNFQIAVKKAANHCGLMEYLPN